METTARDGFVLVHHIVMVSGCCATSTAERHAAEIMALGRSFVALRIERAAG